VRPRQQGEIGLLESSLKGLFWLVVPFIMIWFEGTRTAGLTMLALYIAVFGVIFWFVARDTKIAEEANAIRQKHLSDAHEKSREIVARHLETLARRRNAIVVVDAYGVVDGRAWNREVQHFVDKVIRPELSEAEADAIVSAGMSAFFQELVEETVAQHCENSGATRVDLATPSPIEFEVLCRDVMRKAGWTATLTQSTGDQGADVIAEKDGQKLVIQCKLYANAVGNDAVQQVVAAKAWYGASQAAVVCKAGFTRSATHLANATGVALLDFSELEAFARATA